ncbi:ABC transporter ATP-binding protein [Granulosicoccaceae sp. 1_MG-2023]|nr:ABC transporter ATP-binding protein [Granulosicoccaceae sp. 1_MG-2023]
MSANNPSDPARAPLLQTERLCRSFAGRDVVRDISLRLRHGEVLGLLGLNGAGKSTTLSMICGVLAPTDGWIRINGHDISQYPDQARCSIGYLPDTPPLYPELRVSEYLRYCARLHRLQGADLETALERALNLCQLGEVSSRLIGNLSKGFRQRVGLAQAIIHAPELLVLDEPGSGLDPVQMMEMRELIRSLSSHCGVIFSSHILPEVVDVCQRVAVIHHGRLVHEETLQPNNNTGIRHFVLDTASPAAREDLLATPQVSDAQMLGELRWQLSLPGEQAAAVIASLVKRGVSVSAFSEQHDDLEARFAALTTGRHGPHGESA